MGSPARGWLRRWWRPLRVVLSFALLGVAIWVVSGKSSELSGATAFLSQLRWEWIALAGLAELCSYLALAQLQRSLLQAGGVPVRLARASLIAFAGSAIQAALPVGAAFAGVYEFRQFEFVGADDVLAGFVVVGSAVVAFATLAVLAGCGLALAASLGSAYDLVGAILGVVCFALLVVVAWARRGLVYHFAVRAAAWAERLFHRPAGQWVEPMAAGIDRVRAVAPGTSEILAALAASTASWLADCMCLALAFMSVGVGVPWQGLLLAYCGGQLAVNLPITPGGLGVVEGSLTVALVAFGGGQASTVAAVLLYRVLSFWLPLPVGGVTYLILARVRHKQERAVLPDPHPGLASTTGPADASVPGTAGNGTSARSGETPTASRTVKSRAQLRGPAGAGPPPDQDGASPGRDMSEELQNDEGS